MLTATQRANRALTLGERAAFLAEKAKEVRSRILSMIYKAKSGHPGGALSAADIVTALYFDILRVDPANPRWPIGTVSFYRRATPVPSCTPALP